MFQTIVRSFYDKAFYAEAVAHSFWKRYWTLYVVHVVFAVVLLVSLQKIYVESKPEVQGFAKSLEKSLPTLYPSELVMTVKDGELSINQEEPYDLGAGVQKTIGMTDPEATDELASLIIIDTSATVEDFESYKTAVLLTQKGFVVRQSEGGEIRYYPYSQFLTDEQSSKGFVLNQKMYADFVTQLAPYVTRIPEFVTYAFIATGIILVVLVPFFLVSGWLMSLLFLSILGYFVSRLIKRPQTYGAVYKMGMYLAIPLTLFQNIHSLFGLLGTNAVPDLSGYAWLVYLLLVAIFIPVPVTPVTSPMDPPVSTKSPTALS